MSSSASSHSSPKQADAFAVSGRNKLVGNVLASWAAQMVFVVAGFIMPHMIDRKLGKELLGIWYLGWSVIAYFSLVTLGVVSSINRYVAKHRAAGDLPGINRSVSSIFCILSVMATVIVLLTIGAAFMVPVMSKRVGTHGAEVTWIILCLGCASAVQAATASFSGVLTGCHHWKIHNGLHAIGYATTVAAMVTVLWLGCGIRTLAFVYFCGDVIPNLIRVRLAYWACPGLSVRFKNADRQTARTMMHFGGKSFLPDIADLLANTTVSFLIGAYLGPGMLAVYNRPRSLVLQVRTLVSKMASVIVPSASSLQSLGRQDSVQDLVIKATRYAGFLTLPLTTTFIILGGPILQVWMGNGYDNALLIAILAAGYTSYIVQIPTLSILMALNLHGRPAVANLTGSIISASTVYFVMAALKVGLPGIAAAATVPLSLVFAVYVPIYTCRQLNIPLRKYYWRALLGPLLNMIPFAACLVAVRFAFPDQPWVALISGGLVGAVVLGLLYWRKVLPESLKATLLSKLKSKPAPPAKPPAVVCQ